MTESTRTIGIIGGSGLYEMEGLTGVEEVRLSTPFGEPSDAFITARLGDAKLVFLPRHGRGHRLAPHEINYRANIYGMKKLGVEWIVSVSAVGSQIVRTTRGVARTSSSSMKSRLTMRRMT